VTDPDLDQLTPLQRAFVALKEMRQRLETLERERNEPIAVIGLGCRFPGGANDAASFWDMLRDGRDAIRAVPKERYDVDALYDPTPATPGKVYCKVGGFVEDLDLFGAGFFHISPREAEVLDPQQRWALEVGWEAVENAGHAHDLAGSRTGVFLGVSMTDYGAGVARHTLQDNAYYGVGNTLNSVPGRLSYALGLRGPSLAVDTACSSSLVAVHLACESLKRGECDMALAGGVNALLDPGVTVNICQARMLSPDGRCKTFDASADGYVRGEGCGIIVLKRLSDAERDRDRILAVLRATAVNHGGASSGFTVPNPVAQADLMRDTWRAAGIGPADLDYLEAHGTGTSLGDPIEVEAIDAALASGRDASHKLPIGTVKTNIGHLESAAGIAALIKVIVCLENEALAANLHFKNPNPHIAWDKVRVAVVDRTRPWRRGARRRVAGVSSFGLSGTNAHAVVTEAPERTAATTAAPPPPERSVEVVPLSAQDDVALKALAGRMADHLVLHPEESLADVGFTLRTGRADFAERVACVAADPMEAGRKLRAFSEGKPADVASGKARRERARVAFLFSGQGAQYVGMARELHEREPAFRAALDRCAAALAPLRERPLRDVLFPKDDPGEAAPLHQTEYTQPALFALEYALAELWKELGVAPATLLGHSIGEYVAACLAGAFSVEDGVRLVAARASLMQRISEAGGMATLFADEATVAPLLAGTRRLSIAAANSPQNTVLSGPNDELDAALARAKEAGLKSTRLKVSHAFHSPLMEPILEEFRKVAAGVAFAPLRLPVVSNLTGRFAEGNELVHADYWVEHLRRCVRFADGMRTLATRRPTAYLEIGPSAALLSMGQQCVPGSPAGDWLPSLRKGRGDHATLLASLGALWVHGVAVDWDGHDAGRPRRRVALPTYPFQRERFWVEPPAPQPVAEDPRAWLHEFQWKASAPARAAASGAGSGAWLVLADKSGVGAQLKARLAESGARVVTAYAGSTYRANDDGTVTLDAAQADHYTRLLESLGGAPLHGVVDLFPLDANDSGPLRRADVEAGARVVLQRALLLSQALIRAPDGARAKLWFVTRGAQAVEGDASRIAAAQAMVWGFARVLASEHPALFGGLVDLDPADPPADAARALFDDVLAAGDENQVAFRGGRRHAVRLLPLRVEAAAPTKFRKDGSYLITGGCGALGLEVARFLFERGAGPLLLVGRGGASTPAAEQAIVDLRARGADVRVCKVDLADRAALAKLLKDSAAELPPLRGIMHAAGVLKDGLLARLEWPDFERVLLPKVQGTLHLDELTRGLPLEFFVLFSSISVIGAPGQCNYAAANCFLDAFAHRRRAQGLPCLSINWGPWAEVGMAKQVLDVRRLAEERGMYAFKTGPALAAMDLLMAGGPLQGPVQGSVLHFHWKRLFAPDFFFSRSPLLKALKEIHQGSDPVTATRVTRGDAPAARADHAAGDASSEAGVEAFVRAEVARVLGHKSGASLDGERPLLHLGLDSLMAVQLRNTLSEAFGVDLPVSDLLSGASAAELAKSAWQRVEERRGPAAAVAPAGPRTA
jgi:acyl transferase domain-containing protein/acyl carrier protein